jgi:quercetin dioxygenase-like cupin family protein
MSDIFFPGRDCPVTVLDPGKVSRSLRARGGGLMAVEVVFASGGVGAVHTHPHEQISYCLSGSFSYTVEGETFSLGPGDSVYVAPDLRHGTACLEAGVLLDVFSPQRRDFLA